MKKFITAFLFGIFSLNAIAIDPFTIERTLKCGDIEDLAVNLERDFGETPMLKFIRTGSNNTVAIIVFINAEKGTTTIVEATRNGESCILTEGENMGMAAKKNSI